jgi:large subunit ribosomal protein L7/L12
MAPASSFHTSSPVLSDPKEEKKSKVDEIFHKILYLDMFEVHLLTELISEKLGLKVNPASVSAAASSQEGAPAKEAAAAEKKSSFDLKLVGFDAKAKIKVIKEVRAIAGLGLKDAKELVEGAPKVIKKDLKQEEADELKAKLEAIGATVEIS